MNIQKLNPQIQKVVCIVNRLNVAPRSLRAGVEAELVEAVKELSDAEANIDTPVDRLELEARIADYQTMVKREKDGAKLVRLVGKIRELKARLS
jgi:hypothetical protein